MTDLDVLSKRLAKMERRFRWTMRGGIIVVMLAASVAVMAQVRGPVIPGDIVPNRGIRMQTSERVPDIPVEAEVRSRHFVLLDDKGKERASLVADNAGSVFLVMFDSAGKTRANLSVNNDGPSLIFYDSSGRQRTIIGSTTAVGSHVNENGIMEKAPASSIILFDKGGKLLWRQP